MAATATDNQQRFDSPETLERGLLLAAVALAATALFLQMGLSIYGLTRQIVHELSGVAASL